MDPMRNREQFYKNVSSERTFRENTDWISTGNTEGADVLDAFVLKASVCTVKTYSQTSVPTSMPWEREGQPTAVQQSNKSGSTLNISKSMGIIQLFRK